MAGIAPAEFESDTAEDQAEQHGDERRVERRQDDRISERERRHQPAAAEHQPGLVAVPDRRDRVHRAIASPSDRESGEEDADAEIEAVHDDVHRDREGDDHGPDHGEVHQPSSPPGSTAAAGVMPALRIGALTGAVSPAAGARAISFNMYQVPAAKTEK